MIDDPLKTALLDLWQQAGDRSTQLLLGGGYGLYLKQQAIAAGGEQTLISAELWPPPRTTQDLDVLLTTELVGDERAMKAIRKALDQLGYTVVPGSEYLQFSLTLGSGKIVKVDLLTAQLDALRSDPTIRADDRRARPHSAKKSNLHAHPTDGAMNLEDAGPTVVVDGNRSDGCSASFDVRLPHAFTYLLMKLTAYRDRKSDEQKDLGQHHALDVFRIVAMLTRGELVEICQKAKEHQADAQVQSCRMVALRDFMTPTSDGIRAMRNHALWQNDSQLGPFFDALGEVFRD